MVALFGRLPRFARHRSAALRAEPATLSHRFAPLPHIAGALADLPGLAIGMAAAFAVLFLMRGTL